MKKILVYLFVILMMVSAASAYPTFVTLTVNSIAIDNGGVSCSSISGDTDTREVCISTSSACGCIAGSSFVLGNTISNGGAYTTGFVELTKNQLYYACLKLTEDDSQTNYVTGYPLNDCSTISTIYVLKRFNLGGCSCGGYSYGYIDNSQTQQDLTFSYQFIA